MTARKRTKRDFVAAFREMHSIAQELYGCYANDTQPHRAEAMAALKKRADKLSEIAWDEPL